LLSRRSRKGNAIAADVSSLPLPLGWEQRLTADGRVFFVDHNSKTTTFQGKTLLDQNSLIYQTRAWRFLARRLVPNTAAILGSNSGLSAKQIVRFAGKSPAILK
jgi:hypothetical protein